LFHLLLTRLKHDCSHASVRRCLRDISNLKHTWRAVHTHFSVQTESDTASHLDPPLQISMWTVDHLSISQLSPMLHKSYLMTSQALEEPIQS